MDGFAFWHFSIWVYRQDGVPAACLHLQERHGLDVNILLFAFWLARCGRTVDAPVLASLSSEASLWHETVVLPLRAIRTRLKSGGFATSDGTVSRYRDRIKAEEIGAEKLEQEILFLAARRKFGDLAPMSRQGETAGAKDANVLAYFTLLGCFVSEEDAVALDRLGQSAGAYAASSGAD